MGVTKVPHFVTKVPDLLRKCPICYESALLPVTKVPYQSYNSSLPLQKFPSSLLKCPRCVTKVPFLRYKSAQSSGSLSLSLSLDGNVRAKEGGKEITGETSSISCFQDGGKNNGARICNF